MRKGTETLLAGALSIALAQLLLAQEVPGPSPAAARESVSAAQRVDALFAPWSKGDTPGAAVIVIRNGQVLFEKGYGLANLETRTPIRPDTAFLLASLTKQFTAMAVMMLAERGKIRYEDPLTRFFPHFPLYAQKITVRHLLNHTAGFPEYDDLWIRSGKVDHDWPRSSATRPSTFEPTSRDALNLLAQQKSPDFDPGEKWKYSDSGYVILAQIVEKASGTSFGAFLEENIFRPLGMKGSLLYDERKPKVPNVAKSYTRDGSAYREIDYTPLNKIYGEDNVYSTLDDMYKWDQALYGEKLVKASTLRIRLAPRPISRPRQAVARRLLAGLPHPHPSVPRAAFHGRRPVERLSTRAREDRGQDRQDLPRRQDDVSRRAGGRCLCPAWVRRQV